MPKFSVPHFSVHMEKLGNNGQLIGLFWGLNEDTKWVNKCKDLKHVHNTVGSNIKIFDIQPQRAEFAVSLSAKGVKVVAGLHSLLLWAPARD